MASRVTTMLSSDSKDDTLKSAPNVALPSKLRVEGLTKRYGEFTALEPTDLAIAPGEFVTLLGPSGSGKTTLLQLICGLIDATSGRVLIDGVDQAGIPAHRRDIGLVFQNYALFPHMTVNENVSFPLLMRRVSEPEKSRRVEETLAMVQMGHLGHRFSRELSGGQQQRVALARCFVYRPSIILMDEPLGALDKKLREQLQLELKRLHRETSATIIYVTHDQEEALALSDRIVLMNQARIEQIGTPEQIYRRPATAFAAAFIGTSNIIRGNVVQDKGKACFRTVLGEFELAASREIERDGALVVRPEHLKVGDAGSNRLTGTVEDVVFAGAENRVIVRAEGNLLVTSCPARTQPPILGTQITLSWDPSDAVIVP
jgi:putative spermidine/putrescine transport system ATP-binding protein